MSDACDTLVVTLPDEAATLDLGRRLAHALQGGVRVILLYGDLGSGKTTLVRGLVAALPGGDRAETSSPSFTLCNIYPTQPEIAHCDLYRADESRPVPLPEEAENVLECGGAVAAEWAERLGTAYLPPVRLDIRLEACHNPGSATLTAHGGPARACLCALREALPGADCESSAAARDGSDAPA